MVALIWHLKVFEVFFNAFYTAKGSEKSSISLKRASIEVNSCLIVGVPRNKTRGKVCNVNTVSNVPQNFFAFTNTITCTYGASNSQEILFWKFIICNSRNFLGNAEETYVCIYACQRRTYKVEWHLTNWWLVYNITPFNFEGLILNKRIIQEIYPFISQKFYW